ncbi:MAG: LacI family DNA-binding transcriptional regulator [Mycetocola sp.]
MNQPSPRPRRSSVTMADVAAHAGVSRALVSLVVRDSPLVSDAKRAAVHASIAELGYRHNQIASRLAASSTRTLGLLLLDLHNTVYADLHDGVMEVTEPAGYQVLLIAGSRDPERQRQAISRLVAMQVDGLILAAYTGTDQELRGLVGEIPVVVANRRLDAPGIDSVYSDDAAGMEQAISHLEAAGHSRISHISAPSSQLSDRRRDGYISVMVEHGLVPHVVEGDLTEAGGRRATADITAHSPAPTAVIAHNDVTAVGLLSGLQQIGTAVPEQMAVVGFDNTQLSAVAAINLTTVDQHARELGAVAARMMMERLADPALPSRAIAVPPTLIVRGSTRS